MKPIFCRRAWSNHIPSHQAGTRPKTKEIAVICGILVKIGIFTSKELSNKDNTVSRTKDSIGTSIHPIRRRLIAIRQRDFLKIVASLFETLSDKILVANTIDTLFFQIDLKALRLPGLRLRKGLKIARNQKRNKNCDPEQPGMEGDRSMSTR